LHAWDILKDHPQWQPNAGNRRQKNKKRVTESSSGSKRSRLNEDGVFSSPSNPDTPTSVPSTNNSTSKGKGKALSEDSWQTSVDALNRFTLSREEETRMELEKNQVELKRKQVEEAKVAIKKRKQDIKLLEMFQSKEYLTPREEELVSKILQRLSD